MIPMAHPRIVVPTKVSAGKGGNVTIEIDDKLALSDKDGSAAWVVYGLERSSWLMGKTSPDNKFSKAYPAETSYRHSLAEEAAALKMVAESASRFVQEKKVTELDPSLANLIKLKDAGLIEAYILFARADEGIARDYAAYRREIVIN